MTALPSRGGFITCLIIRKSARHDHRPLRVLRGQFACLAYLGTEHLVDDAFAPAPKDRERLLWRKSTFERDSVPT